MHSLNFHRVISTFIYFKYLEVDALVHYVWTTVDYNVYIAFCPQRGHKKANKLDYTKIFKKGNRDQKGY